MGGHCPLEHALFGLPEPRELVSTVTEERLRSVSLDPQSGQWGFNPAEYSEILARITNAVSQFRQT